MKLRANPGIRTKLVGLIIFVFSLLAIATQSLFESYINRNFEALELDRALKNTARVQQAVQSLTERLRRTTVVDWGQYDKAYAFVTGKDSDFNESELYYESLEATQFAHYIVLNEAGLLLTSGHVSSDEKAIRPIPQESLDRIVRHAQVVEFVNSPHARGLAGLLMIEGRPYFIAVAPVVPTSGFSKPGGFLIFTKSADPTNLAEISELTQLTLSFTDVVSDPSMRFTQSDMRTHIADGKAQGQTYIRDLGGQPILVASFEYPHTIMDQGVATKDTLVFTILTFLVLASLVLATAIDLLVSRPLKEMTSVLSQAHGCEILQRRIVSRRTDEIGILARIFNSLMDSLSSSYTDLELAKGIAENANAAKSRFIAKVSHELRTPIHGVIGMLRILLKEETSEARRSYISMASDSAFGLLQTINEILDFSKVEAGKMNLERIPFHLRESIMDALRSVAPRVDENPSLELLYEICPDVPDSFEGDPLRLKQCLVNLLGNAVKFTREGTVSLSVSTSYSNEGVAMIQFDVCDTGVGIPEDRLARIFDPFAQADDSVSRLYTGTGLGLTIVKQISELMGGSISVKSEIGLGTTFTLVAPLTQTLPSNRLKLEIFKNKRVAVVDASVAWGTFMQKGFERCGLSTTLFSSADRVALRELGQELESYDLLVITSEGAQRSAAFDLIVRAAFQKQIPLAVVLAPFEISLRERLIALKVPYLFTRPVSVDEIIRAFTSQQKVESCKWHVNEQIALLQDRQLNVLIADDAVTNRIILTSMLEDAGHKVTCLENGLDLLNTLEPLVKSGSATDSFDIVLTDVQMPLMDGITVTRKIRELERTGNTLQRLPIVAVTAHAMHDENVTFTEAGVDGVVTKPIDPLKLADTLRQMCSRKPRRVVAERKLLQPKKESGIIEETHEFLRRQWHQMISEIASVELTTSTLENQPIEAVFNLIEIFERVGNSLRRTRLVLEGFVESYQELLSRTLRTKESGDLKAMGRAAHALKGLLLDIGAKTSSQLAGRLEAIASSGDFAGATEIITPLSQQTLVVVRLVELALEKIDIAQQPTEPSADVTGMHVVQ
jgi:signal transduction histidine kinase/CheY-like chemotaxis protein